jgi:exosortase/archaeosortase family protein
MKTIVRKIRVFEDMPKDVRNFLVRALVIFLIWKLLYHLLLFPIRIPDEQLTNLTAISTAFLYSHLLDEPKIVLKEEADKDGYYTTLSVPGRRVVGIADSCNGLELLVLYIGFILCLPAPTKTQLYYLFGGIAGIIILNCFRCVGLAWLFMNGYRIADFAHKYLFKMIIYGAMFYTWVRYSKHFDAVPE